MAASITALLPVFLTIIAGVALFRTKLVGDEMWSVLEHVCYYVLFPAFLFQKIAITDLSGAPVLRMGGAMLLAIATMAVLLLVLRVRLMTRFTMTGAAFTSVFQGSTRWHTFVALSIIALIHGEEGLTLAAIGMAAMIPFLNVTNVAVISYYAEGMRPALPRVALLVLSNPLVLACITGIAWNMSGLTLPQAIVETLGLIGAGALGIGLLAVGASLRPKTALVELPPVALATFLRLIVMPVLMFVWATVLGVDGLARTVAVISGAVPTASASYILARQLGGDSVLMANIITIQVAAAAVTLPLMTWMLTG